MNRFVHDSIELRSDFKVKVAFLDRDGTVIKDYDDDEWINITQPEFLPYALESLKKICDLGYKIIFISNQYLINDKKISIDQFKAVNELFLSALKEYGIDILAFYYCPHSEEENCNCKKPKPGMILSALADYPMIKLESSFYVGDSEVDLGIASYFDLKTFYLKKLKANHGFEKVHEIKDLREVLANIK